MQPCHIDSKGEVAIADLQRRRGGADITARIESSNHNTSVDFMINGRNCRYTESKYAGAESREMHYPVLVSVQILMGIVRPVRRTHTTHLMQ